MTTSPTHSDFQRAAALIGHRANGNAEGVRFTMQAANEANRVTALLIALLDGYRLVASELRTEHALGAVGEFIEACAAQDEDADVRRAAAAFVAHRDNDLDAFNTVLIEANDDGRPGEVVAGVLDLFSTLLPELGTPVALANLAQWTARIAAQGDDQ